jgi:hypothetical protein
VDFFRFERSDTSFAYFGSERPSSCLSALLPLADPLGQAPPGNRIEARRRLQASVNIALGRISVFGRVGESEPHKSRPSLPSHND